MKDNADKKELEKFQLAVEGASDHIVITDSNGIILYANPAVENVTGFSKEEVTGTKAGTLWGGLMDSVFYRKMWQTIKHDKKPFIGEIKNRKKSGLEYYANARISPVRLSTLSASKEM